MAETRYTLSLPAEVYHQLRQVSEDRGVSIKDVVRQCLKVGLVAVKVDGDPDKELLIRERQPGSNGSNTYKEIQLQFIW